MYSYELRLVPRLYDPAAWTEADRELVASHATHLEDLRARGIVLLAGRTDSSNPDIRGIVLFEAADDEAARAIMEADPAVAGGAMEARLAPFSLAVGAFAPAPDRQDPEPPTACRLDTATFVPPREEMPWLLALVFTLAEKKIGGPLLGLRALAHYPKALVGAGLLEAFICHGDRDAAPRLLALVRLAVSYAVSCPFCVDLNGADFRSLGIAEAELAALRGEAEAEEQAGFSEAEKAAIAYARAVSRTPVRISEEEAARLSAAVGVRGFAIVASTAAQVNFWARLLQAFGAPPAFVAREAGPLALERFANPLRK